MWSRVKEMTEQELKAIGGVCWRPAVIDAEPSTSTPKIYRMLQPAITALMRRSRKYYVTGENLGRAMLQATVEKVRSRVIENPEIWELAARNRGVGKS